MLFPKPPAPPVTSAMRVLDMGPPSSWGRDHSTLERVTVQRGGGAFFSPGGACLSVEPGGGARIPYAERRSLQAGSSLPRPEGRALMLRHDASGVSRQVDPRGRPLPGKGEERQGSVHLC